MKDLIWANYLFSFFLLLYVNFLYLIMSMASHEIFSLKNDRRVVVCGEGDKVNKDKICFYPGIQTVK